jgi:methionyl-tRNA formyltransferase
LLPKKVLAAPRLGCINIHGSLLPRWRGAAPIQRAILAGDAETGITIMQMDEGLDTGPMLYKIHCPIGTQDTSETLYQRLATLGAEALLTTLDQIVNQRAHAEIQENSLATYAHKITKEEGKIDWQQSAIEIDRKVRAFNPWPVAFTDCGSKTLRVWQASVSMDAPSADTKNYKPGMIIDIYPEGIDVQTGNGVLRLEKIQLPGERVLNVSDFFYSTRKEFSPGTILGSQS